MRIYKRPIEWYVRKLEKGNYFAFPGYSDAEWFSMMGIREGQKTGLGQLMTREHGRRLLDVMRRRVDDPKWLFAVPECLWRIPQFEKTSIDSFLQEEGIDLKYAYERDMVLDDLARDAGLYPLIKQLQEMDTVVIGPKELEKPLTFLDYKAFIPITSPNLHMEKGGIEHAVVRALGYDAVYLISAGVSAPVIIDQLYKDNPNAFYIDCGSIWDAFAGIGGQRTWRADLYGDSFKLQEWKRKNLYGPG